VYSFAPELPAAATLALPDAGWRISGVLADASATSDYGNRGCG